MGVEEERVKSQLAAQVTPNLVAEDGNENKIDDILAESLGNLPPKARLGLQAKSAIDKKEPVSGIFKFLTSLGDLGIKNVSWI